MTKKPKTIKGNIPVDSRKYYSLEYFFDADGYVHINRLGRDMSAFELIGLLNHVMLDLHKMVDEGFDAGKETKYVVDKDGKRKPL